MTHRHWTNEEMIERLYCGGEARGCAECDARWAELLRRRAQAMAEEAGPELDERLRRQRLAVYARLERPGGWRAWKVAPVGATAMLLLLGIVLHGPKPEPRQVAVAAVSDAQLFSEVATMVNEESPRAADSLRGLFNEETKLEAQ